jgi:hypothetical protein
MFLKFSEQRSASSFKVEGKLNSNQLEVGGLRIFGALPPDYTALYPENIVLHVHHCENLKSNTKQEEQSEEFCVRAGHAVV